ncbi:MAG: Ig-like domain-containing protein [Chloroflexi bacterium]|nr:Ig-like domain-containing protein [Chloroflexota bacterium]MBP8056189.1 Ig-like domain-containing protein [Chloroflexota bacterium]
MRIRPSHQRFVQVIMAVAMLTSLFSPLVARPVQAVPSFDESTITLDGLRDADYVQIAEDPAGDLASPGPGDWSGVAWTDMRGMYAAATATTLYLYIPSPAYNNVDSSGQIGLAIDTNSVPNSGGTTDAWGNAITFSFDNIDGVPSAQPLLPDYLIRGNVSREGGWTEFRAWNGNWDTGAGVNWGGITSGDIGTHIAYSYGNGIEFAIPLADIGNPDPAHVKLQFFATQSGGGKGAYDTVPSDDQSTGWDDPTTQHNLVTVPVAVDAQGDLANPGPANWNGVAWTDTTRLHIWADSQDLHLFVPMAYTTTVSVGQLGLAIDTGLPGGGSGDPWGNAVTYAYTATHQNLGSTPVTVPLTQPDYLIRGNIFGPSDNGWTEFRTWNGSDWNTGGGVDWGGIGNSGQPSLPGSKIAWSNGDGLRLRIPLTDIAVAGGDTINLQFFGTQGGGSKGAYDTVPSDDQSNGWDDATTQRFLATYTIPNLSGGGGGGTGACASGAANDNNIWWNDLGHNSRDTLFRTPGGAVPTGTAVTLRFRSACDDLSAARVRVYNDRTNTQQLINLTKIANDAQYDWWEAVLPVSADPTVYWYRFIALDGTATAYYEDDAARTGGWGQTFASSVDNSWQLTMYDPTFQTPDWVQNGIIYQVFPDRFRDGNAANNTPAGTFFYNETPTIVRSNGTNWNTPICDPRDATSPCPGVYSQNFYGGDLEGLLSQLAYLDSLGVTAIYFNPIFEAPSNHKYDATNFGVIDDNFGTLAQFQSLVAQANALGINIILDGVFNHSSSDSIYFDRYNRYPAPTGACEDQLSQYRDWYYFAAAPIPGSGPCVGDDGTPGGSTYTSWFGFDSLPKLDSSNQEVRDYIWAGGANAIARYWMQWADGWRLDVGGDVDPGTTNDPTNNYWEGFRTAVHQTNPDAYIVGEEWNVATSWTLGNEWDATMNYQFGSAIMSFWRDEPFVDNDHNSGSSAGILTPLTPQQLDERLHNLEERYPPEAFYAMMNLLGSHDTNRALFMLDHNTDLNDATIYQNPAYDWSDAMTRLRGVVLLQMTLPGAPTIYYGDEVGLVGPVTYDGSTWQDDPYNRIPYPWLDQSGTPFYTHLQTQGGQDQLRDYYTVLTTARNAHPALRTGSFDTLLVDNAANTYAYGRKMADNSDAAVVMFNRATGGQNVVVNVSGYLPIGAQLLNVLDNQSYTVDGNGDITVTLSPMSGALLIVTSVLPQAPSAPTGLAVTAERSEELDLSWNASAGADSYDLYRSVVSGGGYQYITTTVGTTHTDAGLVNATTYYYTVIARDDTTGLVSAPSNEASGTPHHDLTTAWYNLQAPAEITHTISTITATVNISGQLRITGATGSNGPATGIWGQIGFGAVGSTPNASWTWVDMVYGAAAGNNDEYFGKLLPDTLGDYEYVTRWSSDGGQTWYLSDLSGPGDNNDRGLLHVVASPDTTAPAATVLVMDGTTPSSILLSWTLNSEPDLAGYEIYRQVNPAGGYSQIDTVWGPVTNYVDEAVVTNVTYDYYVVAFDTSFNRSPQSNVVTATAEARLVDVTFEVTVPAYTPGTAYLSFTVNPDGTLNLWNPGGTAMTRANSTTFTKTLTILDGTLFEYKVARGSWDTVEKEADGNTEIPNRSLTVDFGTNGTQLVQITVQNWRDPIVTSLTPANGSANVLPNTVITAVWNQAMPATPNSGFQVMGPDGVVSGTFGYDSTTFTHVFTPSAPLTQGATYTVTIAGVVDVNNDVQQVPAVSIFSVFIPTSVSLSAFSGQPVSLWLPVVAMMLIGLLGGVWVYRRRVESGD